jgi:subtilisin family serine protease
MRIRSIGVLLGTAAVTALGLANVPLVNAQATNSISAAQNETATRWFVQFQGNPRARGSSAAQLAAERQAFRTAASASGIQFKERFTYDTLWNGMSIDLRSPIDASTLRSVPGVKAVYPVISIDAPLRGESDGETGVAMATAITQTGVDIARAQLGLRGAGIKVGVIDTGIDYDHPDLGGGFGPGYKVAYGYDFVGDNYNAGGTGNQPIPVPDEDPDDCNGHGTHVAGIVGAKAAAPGGVTGVAPDVTLGAYRVFGCAGSSSADVIIAALERAYADGMDVINQSLGAAFQWPQYPTGQVGDELVRNGVVVVASAGNNGATGTWSIGAPGVGTDVIGVASFENVAVTQSFFSVSPDGRNVGYLSASGVPLAPTSGTFPLARTGSQTVTNDACTALPAGSLAGKVALIRRGTCGFFIKATNAQAAGAIGVVLYNNQPGFLNANASGTPAVTIPVVGITQVDGNALDTRLAAGSVDLTWQSGVTSVTNPSGNLMSTFSSYGLSPDLALKPDIGAPGGNIYSTYPIELGRYTVLSGTSMSAPHVAGAVALLLEARPDTTAGSVRAMLQNAADPRAWFGNPALGLLEPAQRQGAGMLDIDDTINSAVTVAPGKLSLGESEAGPQTRLLTVRNAGSEPLTLNLSKVDSLATTRAIADSGTATTPGPVSGLNWFVSSANVAFSANPLVVPAGGTASVAVTISPSASLGDGVTYGGYIVMTPATGAPMRVPFAGFKGDYQSIQPLNGYNGTPGLPALAKLTGPDFVAQPNGATFTLAGDDVPWFLVHFNHGVQRVEFEIVSAATGRRVHPVFANFTEEEFVGRNSTRTQFFAFPWDGTRMHDNGIGTPDHRKVVPNGQYRVNVRALKALGNPANPAHWQVWTSPIVTIARP